jgi:hypothetical protein
MSRTLPAVYRIVQKALKFDEVGESDPLLGAPAPAVRDVFR